jgi:hypothetical protein
MRVFPAPRDSGGSETNMVRCSRGVANTQCRQRRTFVTLADLWQGRPTFEPLLNGLIALRQDHRSRLWNAVLGKGLK